MSGWTAPAIQCIAVWQVPHHLSIYVKGRKSFDIEPGMHRMQMATGRMYDAEYGVGEHNPPGRWE